MTARLLTFLVAVLVLGGCATTNQRVLDTGSQSQLQMRSYQSRVFDTSDRERVLRVIIATLQDLGFVIERADLALGTVSATRLDGNTTRVTVSVQPRPGERTLVRANAQYNVTPVEDPIHYQNFFAALSKSLFLAAQDAD